MKVWISGGGGFVGSNIVQAALDGGHDVLTTANTWTAPEGAPYAVESVDMCDEASVRTSLDAFEPDLVIHCAIMNDWHQMYADREAAWASYVEATRHTQAGAAAAEATYVLVSTDWVYDGTQAGAHEETPPNPINLYGTLKLASEMVALERGGAVARVSGVNGLHLARPNTPREQDRGFGYFVASIVDALSAGDTFTVWEAPEINMRSTPSLALECGEIMLKIGERREAGVFHCSGADSVTRRELAELTCEVFDLDTGLLRYGPPDPASLMAAPIPHDSSLTTPRTARLLDHPPTPVRTLLERFKGQLADAAGGPAQGVTT
ncbi:MAG: sugar nucleotide-binding protein [Actinomycetota bacterium]